MAENRKHFQLKKQLSLALELDPPTSTSENVSENEMISAASSVSDIQVLFLLTTFS